MEFYNKAIALPQPKGAFPLSKSITMVLWTAIPKNRNIINTAEVLKDPLDDTLFELASATVGQRSLIKP